MAETITKSSWVKTDTCFENIVSVERKKAILTFHIFSSWIGSQQNFLDQRFIYLKFVSVKNQVIKPDGALVTPLNDGASLFV